MCNAYRYAKILSEDVLDFSTFVKVKKVLIITYYWPPSGGGGVMRWLKMSKYLPENGWQPIVYTPSNPDGSVVDNSLQTEVGESVEVLQTPIWEPYDLYRSITGRKKGEKFKAGYISEASSSDWKGKLSVFIRGNILIPDPRMFWVRPSVKYLKSYLKNNHVDAIVTTGPPHSMHLIGLGVKKAFSDIKWIADFRDPWTDIDFYSSLKLTRWADKKHHRLEKQVLLNADHVVTVSPSWQTDLAAKANVHVDLVNNGFDHSDYTNLEEALDNDFTICHLGALNMDRNPHALWQALGEMCSSDHVFKGKLRIKLIGQTDESVLASIIDKGLGDNLDLIAHLPHKEGLKQLKSSQILLLPINDTENAMGILPGKMYEYLAVQRPILAIGPTRADFAKIITDTNAGMCFGFDDSEGVKAALLQSYDLYLSKKLEIQSDSFNTYSRQNQAAKFCQLLDQ